MSAPRANLDRLRAVLKFTLKDGGGGGSLLGSPRTSEEELREILREKYSDRLESINGTAP
jgi:glutamate dehydrogenase/leucine dehydrogenase